MAFVIQRPPVLPSILTLCAMAVLITLGLWQTQRLEWKRDWLNAIEKANMMDESMTPALTIKDFEDQPQEGVLFKRGHIEGRFLPYSQKLGIRTHDGAAGYHAIGLFMLSESDHVIIVNAGWRTLGSDMPPWPENSLRLTGVIRETDMPHFFTPKSRDQDDDMIYALEPQEIAQKAGLQRAPPPASFFIDGDWALSHEIMLHDRSWRPNNNHLHYAIFWFLMAGTLGIIFVLRFMKKP